MSNPDHQEEARRIRADWQRGPQLKLKDMPKSEASAAEGLYPEALARNVLQRMEHLAQVLELLHRTYHENKDLYGDAFLAFVGNHVVREWPSIGIPAASKKAIQVVTADDSERDSFCVPAELYGLDNHHVKYLPDNVRALIKNNLEYEHVTPMTFFRDVLRSYAPLSKEVYYHLLADNYRVAWVTKDEDAALSRNKWRAYRPVDAYESLNPPIELVKTEAHIYLQASSRDRKR